MNVGGRFMQREIFLFSQLKRTRHVKKCLGVERERKRAV